MSESKYRRARVTAPYATVEILAGGKPTVYGFYEGGVFPPEANPVSVDRLVRRGYAEYLDDDEAGEVAESEAAVQAAIEAEAEARIEAAQAEVDALKGETEAETEESEAEAEAEAEESEAEAEAEAEEAEAEAEAEAEEAEMDAPPLRNAKKEEWVAYAVAYRDADVSEEDARAEAEARTKDELIAEFGG